MRLLTSVVLAIALVAGACGGAGTNDDAIVSAVAQWDCDRERFAFDTLEAIDEARSEALTEAGFTEEDVAAFEARLAAEPELRAAVLAEYEAICSGPQDT